MAIMLIKRIASMTIRTLNKAAAILLTYTALAASNRPAISDPVQSPSSTMPGSTRSSVLSTTTPPPPPTPTECPIECFCNTHNRIVYCSRRGLTSIPHEIPSDSIQLNVNGNAFQSPTLRRSNFSRFADLEHLYISECGVERIEVGIFSDLKRLKWLDMSNNRIKVVEEQTFRGSNLQHLFLNGNRHVRLLARSFDGLVTTGLYLHDCSLSELPAEVLRPLVQSIRYLWLNGNELDRLDPQLRPLFASLQHLRLNSNPLRCDCDALWLKELFDASSETFRGAPPPSCLTPSTMKGRLFNETALADFTCTAPMFTRIEALFNGSVGGLRCTAQGVPPPKLYWIQPSGKIATYEKPSAENARSNEGYLVIDAEQADARTNGMFICVATNSAGNVTFTINLPAAASPLASVTRNSFFLASPTTLVPHVGVSIRDPVAGRTTRQTMAGASATGRDNTKAISSRVKGAANPNREERIQTTRKESKDSRLPNTPATVPDADRAGNWADRRFTLSELVGAAVATHICTIVVYALVVSACYWARCRVRRHVRRVHQRNAHYLSAKSTLSPCSALLPDDVYWNGIGRRNIAE